MAKLESVRVALCSLIVAAFAATAPNAAAQPAGQPSDPAATPTPAPATAAVPAAPAANAPVPAAVPAEPPAYSNVKNEWHEGDPLPPGYHAEKEVFVPLVMAGGIELGTSWLTLGVLPGAILLAAAGEADNSNISCVGCLAGGLTLLVPGVGPFLTMIALGANGATEPVGYALLAVDGVIQAGGLGMLIAGLVIQKDVLVRNRPGQASVEIQPMLSAGPGSGFAGVSGHF